MTNLLVSSKTDSNILHVMAMSPISALLLDHIVGSKFDGGLGWKRQALESRTGCTVSIDDAAASEPVCIIISPVRKQFDIVMARQMVEDSLLEFLGPSDENGDIARIRLLYELAETWEGSCDLQRAHDGIVQQRRHGTGQVVWMKSVKVGTLSEDVFISLKARLHQTVWNACRVEVYCHELNNMKSGKTKTKHIVLVYGSCAKTVEGAAGAVKGVLKDFQNGGIHSKNGSKKRNSLLSLDESLSAKSNDGEASERASKKLKSSGIYYKMMVPPWIFAKSAQRNDLFCE